jgi:hypothetical protein
MTMPGFSAEASLRESSGHYQMAVSWVGVSATRVHPAQVECGPCQGGRRLCCRPAPEIGEPEVCWSLRCGPLPSCPPGCVPA